MVKNAFPIKKISSAQIKPVYLKDVKRFYRLLFNSAACLDSFRNVSVSDFGECHCPDEKRVYASFSPIH